MGVPPPKILGGTVPLGIRPCVNMFCACIDRLIVEKIASGTEFEPQLSDSVTLCLCDTIGFYKATYDLPADVVLLPLHLLFSSMFRGT